MQEARHPNKLRNLLADAGITLREASHEVDIPEGTLRKYASGILIIPRGERIRLANLIGCNTQELAPQRKIQEEIPKRLGAHYPMTFEELDMHFSFGAIKTTSLVLDGTGEEAYIPANIHTHYDPQPATFLDEIMEEKAHIEREQEEKQRNGEPYQWNGEKYHLSRIVVSRESVAENMTLGLWFKSRDHYTGLATRRCLDKPAFRAKYLEDHDWYTPLTNMSMSMGIDLTVISSDGFTLITKRGANQSVHRNTFHSSVSEAVSPLDRNTITHAPDLYQSASRGLAEELGLQERADFNASDIHFLSFTVDTHYALYGLRGSVRVNKTAEEILHTWQTGAKDRMENKQIYAVPFTPEGTCAFVFSHDPWAGGLICLYHALVHEYGRQKVNATIAAW